MFDGDPSFLSSDNLWFIQPLSTILIGVAATTAALFAVSANRKIARRKSAIDTVLDSKHDDSLRDGIGKIRELHDDESVDIRRYAKPDHSKSDDAQHIRYVLNFYEYIAIGIENDIYCGKILKESMYSTVIATYEMCSSYIDEVRKKTGRYTVYSDFEKMALSWKLKPLEPANTRNFLSKFK